MKLCFFGSAPIANVTLQSLIDSQHEVLAVFSQPDRPSGRGGKLNMTAVKTKALEIGIDVHTPENIKSTETAELLKSYNPDICVVVAYGHLIPKSLLEIPAHGFVNLHASILPKYRGAAPVPFAILNGEKETGVTVFRLNERFDAGDILAIEKMELTPKDTSATVLEKLAPIGANLVCSILGELEAGWTHPVPQTETEATRAPKMNKEDGLIDWNESAEVIDRKIRAYQPWPLGYTFYGSGKKRKRLVVLDADLLEGTSPHQPGQIVCIDEKHGLVVQCGKATQLRLQQIKPEGKKEMAATDFLRGSQLQPGDTLG